MNGSREVQTLIDLGLTDLQARVYLSLYQKGPSEALTISKVTKVARSDVYRTMEGLQRIGLIEKEISFGEEPPPTDEIITVSGSASNYPDGRRHKADFSMDVTSENGSSSGWLKYQYKRKWLFFRIWMFFASTEITEVVASDGNTATIRGRGTVNGAGNYTFEAVVIDNDPDSFGITIKAPNGSTYYSAPPKNISVGNLDVTIE